jgi:hypothetical protein
VYWVGDIFFFLFYHDDCVVAARSSQGVLCWDRDLVGVCLVFLPSVNIFEKFF